MQSHLIQELGEWPLSHTFCSGPPHKHLVIAVITFSSSIQLDEESNGHAASLMIVGEGRQTGVSCNPGPSDWPQGRTIESLNGLFAPASLSFFPLFPEVIGTARLVVKWGQAKPECSTGTIQSVPDPLSGWLRGSSVKACDNCRRTGPEQKTECHRKHRF